MTENEEKIAESIRNGTYFVQARDWFQAMYIGPISERSFFLIIALLSGLVAFFSISSVMRLMPLTKREAVLIPAGERYDDVQVSLIKLAGDREPVNKAMVEFFLGQYITMRESYVASNFTASARFVRGQSDAATYATYAATYDPANAASPFAPLGLAGQRQVTIDAIRLHESPDGKHTAEVDFTLDTLNGQQQTKSKWTATLDYLYTQIAGDVVDNPETGQKELRVNDPHFQVVNYVLAQRP